MAYMDHIHTCNDHDLTKFVPFVSKEGKQIGWVRKDHLSLLKTYPQALQVLDGVVQLVAPDAMEEVTRSLHEKGVLEHWRNEPYVVNTKYGERSEFVIERCAVPFFGIRAYGVHINGYVRSGDGLKMWIGRRANDRAICPGMLDNMVAGGQPAGLSLMENIIKECAEEANVLEELARTAQSVGLITYTMETDKGIKPDVMFCYDLQVPEGFVPENTDGEVESFELMPIEEVAEIVRDSSEFKFNCNLVIIDFLIRHGVINPDTEPEYEAMVRGLRS
jgi:isopentenyldiphosphate isomerase